MKPITKATVLEAIPQEKPVSFSDLTFYFTLYEQRQYNRLEQTLKKLIIQGKIKLIKEDLTPFDVMFASEEKKHGSMIRYDKFQRI